MSAETVLHQSDTTASNVHISIDRVVWCCVCIATEAGGIGFGFGEESAVQLQSKFVHYVADTYQKADLQFFKEFTYNYYFLIFTLM